MKTHQSCNYVTPCQRCGTMHDRASFAGACCWFAPKAESWCAWCGDPVKGQGRVFCDELCAYSYREDVVPPACVFA